MIHQCKPGEAARFGINWHSTTERAFWSFRIRVWLPPLWNRELYLYRGGFYYGNMRTHLDIGWRRTSDGPGFRWFKSFAI